MDQKLKSMIDALCKAAQQQNIWADVDPSPEDSARICNGTSHEETPHTSEQQPVINTIPNDRTCMACNGYYGPCFEDPLCSTCHTFLYPIIEADIIPSMFEDDSDSDSGNEEPDDGQILFPVDAAGDAPMRRPPAFNGIIRNYIPVIVPEEAREVRRLSVFTIPSGPQVNIERLPPEVLMQLFQELDEVTLWSVGQVNRRWKQILFMCIKQERWEQFLHQRWPLLRAVPRDQDWYEFYNAMMRSACCIKCVKQMTAEESRGNWEENSWRRHRLRTELRVMRNDPIDGIEVQPMDNGCAHWQATIEGPAGSPYEGGLFFLYIHVPPSYPLCPPVVRFITRIFHPNISRHGDIGIDSIHHNWSLALTINKLLISIQSLLTDPYCYVCMEPDIGRLYMENRREFDTQARLWTVRYAMHDMFAH